MFDRKKNDSNPSQTPEPIVPNDNTSTTIQPVRVAQPTQKPLIGKDVHIDGNITFSGDLILEGVVTGNVVSTDEHANLVIQQEASIRGHVKVSNVQHNGVIVGSVESSGLLTVSSTGSVAGPVKYNQLILEMGAVVNGSLEQVQAISVQSEEATETTSAEGVA